MSEGVPYAVMSAVDIIPPELILANSSEEEPMNLKPPELVPVVKAAPVDVDDGVSVNEPY
jgi:hypothetical protein